MVQFQVLRVTKIENEIPGNFIVEFLILRFLSREVGTTSLKYHLKQSIEKHRSLKVSSRYSDSAINMQGLMHI